MKTNNKNIIYNMFPFPLLSFKGNSGWIKILIFLSIILFYFFYQNQKLNYEKSLEGFTQSKDFVLKQNKNIYDDFYVEIYEQITDSKNRNKMYYDIIDEVSPFIENSNVLEIGCGTGDFFDYLYENKQIGYLGIDNSPSMIKHVEPKYKDYVKLGNALDDPLFFQNSTFSHILCLYLTIYEIEEYQKIFKNAIFSLRPEGVFIVHLVEPKSKPDKYPKELKPPFRGIKFKRETDSIEYFKDVIIDDKTGQIRENEMKLFIPSISVIVEIALKAGFQISNIRNLPNNQYLYFFKKGTVQFRKKYSL